MAIDKMNPATWERTGETMPDGAPVLLNPGNGLPCVMPRPNWPNPDIPMTAQVYRNEVKRHIEAAAPDMLAALKALLQIIEDAREDDEFDANTCDAGGIIFGDIASEAVEASRAAIAKAEGAV